tara:strand:+ start:1654 stop:4542 length:2889 start_codon:yes stop_codon:yes gene_type:complete
MKSKKSTQNNKVVQVFDRKQLAKLVEQIVLPPEAILMGQPTANEAFAKIHVPDLLRAFLDFGMLMVATNRSEMEALGEQLAAKTQHGFGENSIYREIEHMSQIQSRRIKERLALRLISTGRETVVDTDIEQPSQVDKKAGERKIRYAANPRVKNKVEKLITAALNNFGIGFENGKLYDPGNVSLDAHFARDTKGKAQGIADILNSEGLFKKSVDNIFGQDLPRVFYGAISPGVAQMGFEAFHEPKIYIDNAFYDRNKMMQKLSSLGFDNFAKWMLSQIENAMLDHIPVLDNYHGDTKHPWTGLDGSRTVYATIFLKVFDSDQKPTFNDEYYQDLLVKSADRLKEIDTRYQKSVAAAIKVTAALIVGAALGAAGGAITGAFSAWWQPATWIGTLVRGFINFVVIEFVALGAIEIAIVDNFVRVYCDKSIYFNNSVIELVKLSDKYFKGNASISQIEKALDDVARTSIELNRFVETEIQKSIEMHRKFGSDNPESITKTSAEVDKFIKDFEAREQSPYVKYVPGTSRKFDVKKRQDELEDIYTKSYNAMEKLEADVKNAKKYLDYIGDGEEKENLKKEIKNAEKELEKLTAKSVAINGELDNLYKGLDYSDPLYQKQYSVLEDYKKKNKAAVDKFLSDLQRDSQALLGNKSEAEAELQKLTQELAAFKKINAERTKDVAEIKSSKPQETNESIKEDKEEKVEKGIIRKTAEAGAKIIGTLAIFWALDKVRKSMAPEKIENSQTVVDVKNYLSAYFNITEDKLARIKDVVKEFPSPDSTFVSKKQEYLVKTIFNRYYAKWANIKGTKKSALGAWFHRPIYLSEISTRYLTGYDPFRIMIGFDVVPHVLAKSNSMLAISKDYKGEFYKQDYNPALLQNFKDALKNTAETLIKGQKILENLKSTKTNEKEQTVDGIPVIVVDDFIDFVKLFNGYYVEALEALNSPGMEPYKRSFYIDRLSRVMEILR